MNYLIKYFSTLVIIILTACDPSNNDNDLIITTNINNSPLFLDLENSIYIETWDIKFSNSKIKFFQQFPLDLIISKRAPFTLNSSYFISLIFTLDDSTS